ncbi:MAG: hypothetical protein F4Y57_11665 [Acidobacteria bacterium]|nr:hypothetical protein [Acidobacteriota bacterium]
MGRGRIVAASMMFGLLAGLAAPAAAQPHVTPWGDPDLQGAWTNATTTPLQRPAELALRESFTEEERAELDAQRALTEQRACATELVVLQTAPPPTSTGSYNSFWLEQGTRTLQTSLIVDPPHGRLPELTPWAQRQADDLVAVRNSLSYPATWEEPSVFERCITRGLPASMMPGFYNHNYQILQTPDYVVIYAEMIHDARVIPLDGRQHVDASIRQWMGDSRGRWEGDTLVVETANFTGKVYERRVSNTVFGASREMRVVERFRRVDGDTLDYRFTVTDPRTFAAPWTAAIPMTTLDGPIIEYACHEGNYSMENMLRGARNKERSR